MVDVVSFSEAMALISLCKKRHLLLGNGFSIALKPDIFMYGSLYENADFSAAPNVKQLFSALGTQDFEIAIKHLQDAAKVVEVYRPTDTALSEKLKHDALVIKEALVNAIAKRHPDRPFDITNKQYAACRQFLHAFDHIFTLNYDVLLYWTLMQDKVDQLVIKHDDGFRHPQENPSSPWVSWQQGNAATVYYLHGALHLFDAGFEIIKYTWSKTDKPIVEQIRAALTAEKYPLFVAEGKSSKKLERILHNGYLHKALRSFEGCCAHANNAIVVFGHALAANDRHVLRCISKGACGDLVVSLFGDPASSVNSAAIAAALALQSERGSGSAKRPALRVIFFDAASASVWG